jgi:hypothetical protein
VVPGGTYTLTYVPAFEVALVASAGGFVSATGQPLQSAETVWEGAGTTLGLSAVASSGYVFDGWNGAGAGSYSGTDATPTVVVNGPIVETATFVALPGARFNLTFQASGLPTGAWWSVSLDGVGYASNTSTLTAGHLYAWTSGPQGRYIVSVPDVYLNSTNLTRYVPISYSNVVGTNGSATPAEVVTYGAQEFLALTTSGGGVVEATYNHAPVGTSTWVTEGAQVSITALPNAGATFVGWSGTGSGSYSGPNNTVQLTVEGPVREVAQFAPVQLPPPPKYSLTVDLATALAAGSVWGLTFAGVGYTSSNGTLVIPGLSGGTYGIVVPTVTSPDGTVQYRATPTDPLSYTVSGNATIQVTYAPYYWVAVSTSVGGSVSPGSGYYPANGLLYLVATPSSGYSFTGWSGTGSGVYSGTNATASIIVTGPVSEVAQFHSSGPATIAASVWSSPETWIGIGAVGLLLGLVAGFLVTRFASRSPGRSRSSSPPTRQSTGGNP